jgi:F-type H+-transporting ATPase subunit b
MKSEAEAKFAEYSKRIETMDEELARVREDMRKAGQGERDRLVKDASEKAERMHAEARFLVEQQMKQLKEELTREAIEAAIVAAETILRERTSAADQQRLAEEYLTKLKSSVAKTQQPGASS